ncbi:unnamed protein product, partial [Ectocarpus fasciculatus]
ASAPVSDTRPLRAHLRRQISLRPPPLGGKKSGVPAAAPACQQGRILAHGQCGGRRRAPGVFCGDTVTVSGGRILAALAPASENTVAAPRRRGGDHRPSASGLDGEAHVFVLLGNLAH